MDSRLPRVSRFGRNSASARWMLLCAASLMLAASPFERAFGQGNGIDQYRQLSPYRYLPQLPEGNNLPPELPRDEAPIGGSDKVLVAELKGLIIVSDAASIQQGEIDETGVHIRTYAGASHYGNFQQMLESHLGSPVSMRNLNYIIRDIVRFYRNHDEPVVDVSVPQQDITDGVVQMVLTESRVGEVRVEGPRYFNAQDLVDQVFIGSGDPIYESWLLDDQRWLMRNPFRDIDLELRPGDIEGTTDVIFNVTDRKPWRFYAGYEDTGNQTTDLERVLFGVNWYNAFNRDDQFGYQFTASPDLTTVKVHSASYSWALANRDIITVFGSYGEVSAPPVFNPFDNTGRFWHVSGRWNRELEDVGCYKHGIQAGLDFKNTNSTLDFGGVFVFASDADIVQAMAGYQGHEYTSWGSYHLAADVFFSPGNVTDQNDSAAYQQLNPGADPQYVYSRAFLETRYDLPHCMELVGRVTGQLASTNLLPPETLGFGGFNSIRGYDQYSFAADSGLFTNLELWSAPYSVVGDEDELRFLAFYDVGQGWSHTTVSGLPNTGMFQSLGAGMRYRHNRYLQVRLDAGYQLSDPVGLPQPDWRVHLGTVASY
jgi:hemolysin activation/secretion protein